MNIQSTTPPPKLSPDDSDAEKKLAKEIVNSLPIWTEENPLAAREVFKNYPRFRIFFLRYLKKFNEVSGEDRKFTFKFVTENTYDIWRIK